MGATAGTLDGQAVDLDNIVSGWFADENRLVMADLIDRYKIRTAIEIGSFLGLSAIWMAQRIAHVTCIDTWREDAVAPTNNNLVSTLDRYGMPRDFLRLFFRNVQEFGVHEKITPIIGKSRDVHSLVADSDLVYIDGDHSYEGCRADIELYGPKARLVICGDDYMPRGGFGVIQAVDQLLPDRQVLNGFWWWCRK